MDRLQKIKEQKRKNKGFYIDIFCYKTYSYNYYFDGKFTWLYAVICEGD